MARKPMSEEQKQKMREQAKARWEKKRAQGEPEPIADEVAEEITKTPQATPVTTDELGEGKDIVEREKPGGLSVAVDSIAEALSTFVEVSREYPNMIEAKQVVDALTEARNKAGQVRGIIRDSVL